MKNKKNIIVIIISFYLLLNFTNQGECSSYSEWLSRFVHLLNVGASIDKKEDSLIKTNLNIMPKAVDSDFNIWFTIFRQKLQVGSMLSDSEAKILDYLLEAKPETSGIEYPYFLRLLDNTIRRIGPIVDDTERKILDYIVRIKPALIVSDKFPSFEKEYLKRHNAIMKHFGNINETDALLLTYFRQAKPEGRIAISVKDPLFQELNTLLLSSTSHLSIALLSNDYVLTEKMVNLMEFFYYRLKEANNRNNDPKLTLLIKRLQNLN